MKGTYFINEVDGFLLAYTSFYRTSPKRLRELKQIAEVDGTGWVEHRRRAILSFIRNYPAVVTHLTEIGSDERTDVKKADAVKATGWIRKITTYKFLLHVGLYLDILGELSYLSLCFQRDDVSIQDVVESLTASKSALNDMINTDIVCSLLSRSLWAQGQPRTCWSCGLEVHEAGLQVGHTLAECKGDIVCNSCGQTGLLARLCPDRSYAARVATGVVEAVPVPASDTVPLVAPVIAPVSDSSAPVEASFPLSCPTSSLIELAETASLPTEAEQDKTAEMVLAEWHAEQDAACTGSRGVRTCFRLLSTFH
ncbi:putative zinc finger protein [Apostichopus japonicus]|uniref:Putative zinc finger protein n=1 Tax=Stichopus japonicus TaxID=307972 RepID=A0A2G8L284_STIJA|nr:putative zinc finger protein [Apostichopus japonicus]